MDPNQPIQNQNPIPEQSQPVQPLAPQTPPMQQPARKSKKPLVIALLIIAVIIIGALGIWAYTIIHEKQIDQEATTLGQQAQADYNKGDYAAAEQKLAQALSLTTKYPNLYSSMIYTLGQEGNISGQEATYYQKAQPYISKSMTLYPNNENVLLAVGYITETAGNYKNALDNYDNVLSIDPKNAEAWFHKGHDLEFLGQQQQAYQAYDTAYSLDAKNPLILLAKGREAAATAKLSDADSYFIQAANTPTADASTRAEAYTDAAQVTRNDFTKLTEALDLAKKAITVDPSYAPGLAQYGLLKYFTGDLVQGVTYLDKSIHQNPRISQNYYYLAGMLRSAKKYSDAETVLKQGLSHVDSDNTLLSTKDKTAEKALLTYELAKTFSFSGGSPETLSYLQQTIQIDSSYKTKIKDDYQKYSYFKELSTNQQFLALIQ